MVQNRCKEYRMEKRIIMLHKVYDIELPYEELGLKTPDKKATITTYIKEMYPDYQDPFNRPLVIICPGGGYDHHSPREGESMAIKMLDLGYNAVVLRYSLAPYVYPTQVYEAAYGMLILTELYLQASQPEDILRHVLVLCGVVIWLHHLQKNTWDVIRNM